MNAQPRDPFKYARVVSLSRKLNAHLHQAARNKVTGAMDQVRQASRVIDTAMSAGTLEVEAISDLLKGAADILYQTEKELREDIAEDNRVVGER